MQRAEDATMRKKAPGGCPPEAPMADGEADLDIEKENAGRKAPSLPDEVRFSMADRVGG